MRLTEAIAGARNKKHPTHINVKTGGIKLMVNLNDDEIDAYAGAFKGAYLHKIWEAQRYALYKAAKDLREHVRKVFSQYVPAAENKNDKYIDKLVDAVSIGKIKRSDRYAETNVNIMGGRSKNSRQYQAKWYATGTEERQTKEGYNRGAIDGSGNEKRKTSKYTYKLGFFLAAQRSIDMTSVLKAYLDAEIQKRSN